MTASKFPVEMLAQHLAIVGKAGSGKTYAAKGFVEHLLEAKRRVCIIDPTGVWYGLRSSADGKRPGWPVAVFGGSHADVAIAEQSGAALAHLVATKNLPTIIDLSEMLIGQRHRFVTEFAEALYRENRTALHLVIDEADEFCPQNPLPETKRMLHHVDRIVRRGRVRGFRVCLITQRPAVLHKNVLTQANTLVALRLTAPQDRAAIKAWVDGQGDAAQGKAVLDSLAKLPRGEGWVWAPELDFLRTVAFPRITTFDSSRAPDEDEAAVDVVSVAAVDLTEIRATFEAVEQKARTLAELETENAALKRKVTAIERAAQKPAAPAPAPREAVVDVRFVKALEKIHAIAGALVGQQQVTIEGPAAPRIEVEPRLKRATPAPAPRASGKPFGDITAPQQRILDALARLHGLEVSAPAKATVAAMAGVSSKSSGYSNNLGALRSAGLIDYPIGGCVALTDRGNDLAKHDGKPATTHDVHEAWLAMVTRPQADILAALIAVYPKAVPKAELASAIGVSAISSGYSNNLGALRSLGAIDYPQGGHVQATPLLFPKGFA